MPTHAEDEVGASESMVPPIPGVVSGMRPARRSLPPLPEASGGPLLSAPALVAVLGWLVALTMLAVDTMHTDFVVSLVIAAIQAALIVAFFMRLGWDSKMHLVFVGIGALLVVWLLLAISTDRSEYQPDFEHWSAGKGGRAAS